jgi:lysyl-tRNA synthetase class 2
MRPFLLPVFSALSIEVFMSWNPTLSWEVAQQRADIIQKIRQFFIARKVVEVETPALSQGTVTDVHLEALSCQYSYFEDSLADKSIALYLQTSPEFHMKRLLASGYGCIFQISKAFRHEEFGRHHNPEFTMLEWYRIGFNHFDLMNEVAELLVLVLNCIKPTICTYQNIFKEIVSLDPLNTNRGELLELLRLHNKLSDWLVEDSINDQNNDTLLQFVFTELIEPKIGNSAPCFVYNFPSSQASLAKISDDDTRVAERFECYYKGVELVNGFHELTNADNQVLRFKQDNLTRKRKGLDARPIDERFIAALNKGLPACAGVALGIDRLVMIALDIDDIAEVLSFPISLA